MKIENSDIDSISSGAFSTLSFRWTLVLFLSDLPITHFQPGVFDGLSNLRELNLQNIQVKKINFNIFAASCPRLKTIYVERCTKTTVKLFGLQNETDLPYLDEVRFFDNNLRKRITQNSFTGLKNIRFMKLNGNAIEVIDTRSFDPFWNALLYLDLSNNSLATLPDGIFGTIDPVNQMDIKLFDNNWYCDCELEFLRKFLQTMTEANRVICSDPPHLRGKILIQLTDLCETFDVQSPDVGMVTDNLQIISSTEVPDSTTPSIEMLFSTSPTEQLIPMPSTGMPMLTQPTKIFQLHEENNSLTVSDFPKNFILLAMENDWTTTRSGMDCISNNYGFNSEQYKLQLHLKPNHTYRFCMLSKETFTILPLECISFYKIPIGIKAWLTKNDQQMISTFVAVVGVTSFLLGLCLAFLFSHRNSGTNTMRKARDPSIEQNSNGVASHIE